MVSKYFFTNKEVFVDQIHNCTTVFHSKQVVNINNDNVFYTLLYDLIFYLNPESMYMKFTRTFLFVKIWNIRKVTSN